MFPLVSGASGAGKSTARRLVADELEPDVECIELHDVVPMPRVPTLAWRQQATEAVLCRALELQQNQGRHLPAGRRPGRGRRGAGCTLG